MGNDTTKLPPDGAAINAIARALGAVVFATVRRLPAAEREAFAQDLALMAQAQSDSGDTTGETLLIDLHQAAVRAARSV